MMCFGSVRQDILGSLVQVVGVAADIDIDTLERHLDNMLVEFALVDNIVLDSIEVVSFANCNIKDTEEEQAEVGGIAAAGNDMLVVVVGMDNMERLILEVREVAVAEVVVDVQLRSKEQQ